MNWRLQTFLNRRLDALKLIYYLLFQELWSDIKNYYLKRWLMNYYNNMAYKESVESGKPGVVGKTKGWKQYQRISKW